MRGWVLIVMLQADIAGPRCESAMVDLAKFTFQDAVWLAGHQGDKQQLLDMLRSDFPLSADDKKYLADFIEGKLKRPRGRPPLVRATDELRNPDLAAVKRAAFYVERLKHDARKEGRSSSGIHEWAVDQTMEFLKKLGLRRPSRQRLENYLRRSKKPRKRVPR